MLGLVLAAGGAMRHHRLSRDAEAPLGSAGVLALAAGVAALAAATLLVIAVS